jgi:(E)-4-hydroxy-3-methylbut-2-enyl-diphosphate synthase
MGTYRSARAVKVGGLCLGDGFPVRIQTMWKDALEAADGAALGRIAALRALGCELLRFAVPDEKAASTLGALAGMTDLPLVADIHFDYRLALKCLDFPIAKIRINPGNIGARFKVEAVVAKAKDKGVPIRIGVNAGSLPRKFSGEADRAAALVAAADEELEILESLGFSDTVVSLKASDPAVAVEAARRFASARDYPLHLGVTEAGPLIAGIVKSTVALTDLLRDGIGATVRVSLSDTMENEIIAAREILAAIGRGRKGVTIVSCPRCGRHSFDTHAFVARWQDRLYALEKDATVAVMGCAVNGPGEASHADLGITGAGNGIIIFKRGEIIGKARPEDADTLFEKELEKL